MRYFKSQTVFVGSNPTLPTKSGDSLIGKDNSSKKPLSLVPFRSNILSYVVKGKSYFTFNEKILGSSPNVVARLCSLMVRRYTFAVCSRKY